MKRRDMHTYILRIIASLMYFGGISAHAETINIGSAHKIEVIDGSIKESTAVDALKYLKNVYNRHSSVTSDLNTILKYYRGSLEPDFLFLFGKSWFLDAFKQSPDGSQSRGQYAGFNGSFSVDDQLTRAYSNFMGVYDGHRNHPIVKNGELVKTVDKAITVLLNEATFGFKDRMSYAWLDSLLRFGALRIYMTGKPSPELEQYIRATYTKTISWNSAMLKKGEYKVDNGQLFALAAKTEGGPAFCGHPKTETISAAIFLNMLSLAIEAEAGARYFSAGSIKLYGGEGTCKYWEMRPFAGAKRNFFAKNGSSFVLDGKNINGLYDFTEFIRTSPTKQHSIEIRASCSSCTAPAFSVSGSWSGELGHSGRFDDYGLWISDVNIGRITINYPPLLNHIMATKENAYDWVGIKRPSDSDRKSVKGGIL